MDTQTTTKTKQLRDAPPLTASRYDGYSIFAHSVRRRVQLDGQLWFPGSPWTQSEVEKRIDEMWRALSFEEKEPFQKMELIEEGEPPPLCTRRVGEAAISTIAMARARVIGDIVLYLGENISNDEKASISRNHRYTGVYELQDGMVNGHSFYKNSTKDVYLYYIDGSWMVGNNKDDEGWWEVVSYAAIPIDITETWKTSASDNKWKEVSGAKITTRKLFEENNSSDAKELGDIILDAKGYPSVSARSSLMGVYRLQSEMVSSRPVYRHEKHNHICLFFSAYSSAWYVSDSISDTVGWFCSYSSSVLPTNVSSPWNVDNGTAWEDIGATVRKAEFSAQEDAAARGVEEDPAALELHDGSTPEVSEVYDKHNGQNPFIENVVACYCGRDMDRGYRTAARKAVIAAQECGLSERKLAYKDYTLAQAISEAVRGRWRVVVYAPRRSGTPGEYFYLKGKYMSEEEAHIEIMSHPRGPDSTRNGKCVYVLQHDTTGNNSEQEADTSEAERTQTAINSAQCFDLDYTFTTC